MRIRSTKPEFWSSEDVARLSREHRLFFLGLWSYVDDNGVGRDDYRLIVADLFPLDDPIESRDFVREGLATLSRGGLITRYEVDGRTFLAVTGWHHQRIDKPGKPRYPQPPEGWRPSPPSSDDDDSRDGVARDSGDSRDGLATASRALDTGTNWTSSGGPSDDSAPDQGQEPGDGAHSEYRGAAPDLTSGSGDSRESLASPREGLAPGTGEQGNRGTGESEASPPPAGARRAGRGERVTAAALAATAHSPTAHTLVSGWAQGRGLLAPQRRELSRAVDGLLRQGADPALVPAALDEAHDNPEWRAPTSSLRFAYERVVRAHHARTHPVQSPLLAVARPSTTDARVAAVDEVFARMGLIDRQDPTDDPGPDPFRLMIEGATG